MEDFTRQTVDVLAKRSANTCANPDCSAITSGPASDESKALNVGEAAHIFGARPGSARFDESMTDATRSNITNGIWLCRNCHKVVDADSQKYPADLLFEWRRTHEEQVAQDLGRTGSRLRQKVLDRKLEQFSNCSYLAQQIIIDKPDAWEYRLTAELLKSELEPIRFKWHALQSELYALPVTQISKDQCAEWLRMILRDASLQVHALGLLVNKAIIKAWGEPGQPGSELEILRACTLIAQATQRLLDWEERVRFSHLPEAFEAVQVELINVAGNQIDKIFEIPRWLSEILNDAKPSGTHSLTITFDLPTGWVERTTKAIASASKRM
ncbi:HNH endonuclease [Polaromonas sp. YR568]|uniref:HNH endonuclease n=1 Tax=Polaromonas sp. YR568 TaxID=1855301 RepID=UPI00398BFFE6